MRRRDGPIGGATGLERALAVTAKAWLLLSWIVVGAALLVAHLAVLVQALGARELAAKYRLLALVPPLAPVVAWIGGRRAAPIAWLVLLVTYVVLRLFE